MSDDHTEAATITPEANPSSSVLITYFGVNLILGGMHSYA